MYLLIGQALLALVGLAFVGSAAFVEPFAEPYSVGRHVLLRDVEVAVFGFVFFAGGYAFGP